MIEDIVLGPCTGRGVLESPNPNFKSVVANNQIETFRYETRDGCDLRSKIDTFLRLFP